MLSMLRNLNNMYFGYSSFDPNYINANHQHILIGDLRIISYTKF